MQVSVSTSKVDIQAEFENLVPFLPEKDKERTSFSVFGHETGKTCTYKLVGKDNSL